MNAVALNGAEVRHLKNPTTGDQLAVIAARGMVFSCWRPSPEEKELLDLGKPVWVVMRGSLVPEFLLTVGDRNQVVPPEIIKRAQRNDEILNSPAGMQAVAKHKRTEWAVEALAWAYAFFAVVGAAGILWLAWLRVGSAIIGWAMGDPLH